MHLVELEIRCLFYLYICIMHSGSLTLTNDDREASHIVNLYWVDIEAFLSWACSLRLALQIQVIMAQSNLKKILAGTILIWNLLCRMTIAIFAGCTFFLRIKKLTILEKNRLKTSIKENGGQIAFGLNQEVCLGLTSLVGRAAHSRK